MKRLVSYQSLFFLLVAGLANVVFAQNVVPAFQAAPTHSPVVPAFHLAQSPVPPIRQVQHQEPSFSQPPVFLPAVPNRPIASEAVSKNYRLQNVPPQTLEGKLIEKLGQRFVPARNIEATPNLTRFRLPVRDGTDVELSIDRQTGVATVFGSAPMVDATIRLVQLLDAPGGNGSLTTDIVPVQRANLLPVRQATETIVRETQRPSTERPPAPNFQRPSDEATAQFSAPNLTDLPIPEGTAGPVVGPVRIDIIDGIEVFVIHGTRSDVERIRAIIEQIESMSLEHEPLIELVGLKHADALRVNQIVQQLYQLVYQQRRGIVTMLPLVKPNTILLIGKKESIDTAKELIEKLDTPVDPASQFRVFRLVNASAAQVQTYLQNFYAGRQMLGAQVLVVADPRTNSIIIQANLRDIAEAAALLEELEGENEARNTVKTFQLRNAMATELATTLQTAMATTTVPGTGIGAAQAGQAGTRTPMLQFATRDANGDLVTASVLTDVRITANARSNMLIVSAPEKTMPLIEALIKELDQLPSAESQIKVFTIANGDATTLMNNVLQILFAPTTTAAGLGAAAQTSQIAVVRPGIEEGESTLVSVRFATDIRTNSIIAVGSAGDLSVVEAILLRLDEENMNNRRVMIFKLVNKPADQLAPVLQQYLTNERQLEIQNSGVYYPQSPAEQYRKEVVIVAEPLSNSLIVSSTPRYVELIRRIVQQLDERPLMVAIQVLIAEVTLTGNRELGVELGLQDSLLFNRSIASGTGGALNPGFLFGNPALGLPLGNVDPGTVGSQGITSLGVGRTGTTSGVGGFTFAASSESLSILIRALETEGRVRILSRPQITALHNLRASIQVGQMVPYITGTNMSYGGTTQNTTDWLDTGIILDVTPRITPDDMVVMDVYTEKSLVGRNEDGVPIGISGGEVIYQPKVNISKAQTTVSAMDGQTIVFAGLITDRKESTKHGVPFFNKIPVVKHLFEYTRNTTERTEMLIVMTPTIIRSETDMELLKQQEASRMHWCLSDVVKLTGNSNMRLRTDDWSDYRSVPVIHGSPVILDDSDLPSEEKIRRELPMPTLAPREN